MLSRAVSLNLAGAALTQKSAEKAYFGSNKPQLKCVNQIWDEDKFWNWAQGIGLPQPKLSKQSGDSQNMLMSARFSALSSLPKGWSRGR